jgi:hypothetical protein
MYKLVTAVFLCVLFAACGGEDEKKKEDEAPKKSAEELAKEVCDCYEAADDNVKYNECTHLWSEKMSELASDADMEKYKEITFECSMVAAP